LFAKVRTKNQEVSEVIMVDKNKLMEELRNLKQQIKSDPRVMAKYDLDGNGEISGEEWELARKAVVASLESEGSSQKQAGSSSAGMAAGIAGAAVGGAAGVPDSADSLSLVGLRSGRRCGMKTGSSARSEMFMIMSNFGSGRRESCTIDSTR